MKDWPDAVYRIIKKAMAKRPDDRYATCEQMAEDLDGVLRGEPEVNGLSSSPDEQAADGDHASDAPEQIAGEEPHRRRWHRAGTGRRIGHRNVGTVGGLPGTA